MQSDQRQRSMASLVWRSSSGDPRGEAAERATTCFPYGCPGELSRRHRDQRARRSQRRHDRSHQLTGQAARVFIIQARNKKDEDYRDIDTGISLATREAHHQRASHLHACQLRAGEDRNERGHRRNRTGQGRPDLARFGGRAQPAADRRGSDRCRATVAQDVDSQTDRAPRSGDARHLLDRHRSVGHPRQGRQHAALQAAGRLSRSGADLHRGWLLRGRQGPAGASAGNGSELAHGRQGGEDQGRWRTDRRRRGAHSHRARDDRAAT